MSKEELELLMYFENIESQTEQTQCGVLCKEDKFFYIKQENKEKLNSSYDINDMTKIKLRNTIYETERGKIKFLSYMIRSADLCYNLFQIYKFGSSDLKGKGYYRLIIPHSNYRHNILLFDKKDVNSYSTRQRNNCAFEYLNFNIFSSNFAISFYNNFIAVECIDEIDFDIFDEYATTALIAYGFINGEVPMDKGYFFKYADKDTFKNGKFCEFKYSANMINSYKNPTPLYYGNPQITSQAFKKMIESMIISKDTNNYLFNNVILTMMLAHQIPKGINSACLYAVALESLTAFLQGELKEKSSKEAVSCEDESQKELVKEVFGKISRLVEFKNQNNKNILDSKIGSLFDTNQDKLTGTFKLLNIKLSKNDEKIIKKRNQLLHGGFKYKSDNLSKQVSENLYLNFQLNLLLNALVFKYIFGFNTEVELRDMSCYHPSTKNIQEVEEECSKKEFDHNYRIF